MKRIFLIILLVAITLSGMAQTIGEAFYIYRNDGQFNAFFRDEVQAIEYSYYDADSIKYEEIVTQVVITADSVYKIPLAAIDSVGFVQPETKYKDDAVPLTGDLFNYLEKADSLTLTFASNTPAALLPKIGDKLVATDLTYKLPIGFNGQVRQVQQGGTGYEVVCDSIGLEEVVTQFYGVVEIVGQQSDGSVRRYLRRRAYSEQSRSFNLVIPPIFNMKLDLSPFVKEKDVYTINGKAVATTTISPVITGKITRVVDNMLNISHYNIHAVTDVTTVTTVEAVGEAVNSDNPLNLSSPKKTLSIQGTKPGPYGIPIYYGFGPKFDMSGEMALGTTIYANFTQTEDITFYPIVEAIGLVMPGLNPIVRQINRVEASVPRMTHFDVDWAYIAGNISARVAVVGRLGIGIAFKGRNLGWVGVEAQVGAKAEADLGFDFESLRKAEQGTGFYDGLKDRSKVVVMPYWGMEGKVSLADDRYQFTFIGRNDYTFWGKKWEWDFLPIFSDTKAVSTGTSVKASANITNDCIIPYTIGFSLFDENNNRIGEPQWNGQKYRLHRDFNFPFETTFNDLETDKKYKVFPTLRLFGFNVLASPSADIDKYFPVTLSDFKVTNSQHETGAFIHEGVAYDYRYDVSVKATLDDDAEGIADWGYVYLDPDGNEASISLKKFGNSYTDTRWAYFRNGTPPFTCTLYGYVKYAGSNETIYDEPYDYLLVNLCPDDNHPHMIDLGLPSGTKWACCNVGATTPQGYGDYFAWGAVQPNYGSHVIAPDIAGTEYDAATANWGNPWRMPTKNQCEELIDYCYSVEANYNGVKGRIFTGQNEFSIFLPATGYYKPSGYRDTGNGHYHSSTYGGNNDNTWALCFDYKSVYLKRDDWRHCRLPVRPCTIENE